MDHWEGIKDAEWFWAGATGWRCRSSAPAETLGAVRTATRTRSTWRSSSWPSARVRGLAWLMLRAGDGGASPASAAHGAALPLQRRGARIRVLDAIGFRLTAPDGGHDRLLCDHEPRPSTAAAERDLLAGAHLAVYDAHFPDVRTRCTGTARRSTRRTWPASTPAPWCWPATTARCSGTGRSAPPSGATAAAPPNFQLAVEGERYRFDARRAAFAKRTGRGGTTR